MQPSQAFHSRILSHYAQAAPIKQIDPYVWKFKEESNKFHSHNDYYKEKFVEPVNNDHVKSAEKVDANAKVNSFTYHTRLVTMFSRIKF